MLVRMSESWGKARVLSIKSKFFIAELTQNCGGTISRFVPSLKNYYLNFRVFQCRGMVQRNCLEHEITPSNKTRILPGSIYSYTELR